jgi:hypothetical protein
MASYVQDGAEIRVLKKSVLSLLLLGLFLISNIISFQQMAGKSMRAEHYKLFLCSEVFNNL